MLLSFLILVSAGGVVSNGPFSFLGVISTFVSYVAKMATGKFEPSLGAVSISECRRPYVCEAVWPVIFFNLLKRIYSGS